MKKLTLIDIIIFIIFLVVSVLSFSLYNNVAGKPEVHVTCGDKEWIYDLSVDTTVTFEGPIGGTTMEIKNNRVHVPSSDCKNQICVLAGWIDKPGEWIACLPNNVFIVIEGQKDENNGVVTDDISY
ncbi:MAG: NusG domain II-containing protein [Pleomorphochaeta sp.]